MLLLCDNMANLVVKAFLVTDGIGCHQLLPLVIVNHVTRTYVCIQLVNMYTLTNIYKDLTTKILQINIAIKNNILYNNNQYNVANSI